MQLTGYIYQLCDPRLCGEKIEEHHILNLVWSGWHDLSQKLLPKSRREDRFPAHPLGGGLRGKALEEISRRSPTISGEVGEMIMLGHPYKPIVLTMAKTGVVT
jgi:hypothetical protein